MFFLSNVLLLMFRYSKTFKMSLFYNFAVLQVYFIRVVILCMEDLESECQRIHYLDNFAASASYYTRSFKPESNPPPYTSISGVAVPVHTSASVLSHNPPPYAPSLNNIGMSVYETSSLLNPAASVSQYGLLSR